MNTIINNTLNAISLKSNIDYNCYINDADFNISVMNLVTKNGLKYDVYYFGCYEAFEVKGLTKNKALKLATVLYCNFDIDFYKSLV